MPGPSTSTTSDSSRRTNNKNSSGGAATGKTKKTKPKYKDPLRNDHYKDPLQQEVIKYKGTFKIPEYRPYDKYHEYVMPDIDPLTGRPRRKRPKVKQENDKLVVPESSKKSDLHSTVFMSDRKSIGSVQRTMRIMESLDF
ncbi:hypothetical protein ACF0H5_022665 [Mactra antiquata]